jgi:two-component system chemotaxis response regulator CheY
MEILEIIDWLLDVEDLACRTYEESAQLVTLDKKTASFLHGLAEEEAMHGHLMGSAKELILKTGGVHKSAVTVTEEQKSRIEQPLRQILKDLQHLEPPKQKILDALVESETSEWNDVFLYVIHYCSRISKNFQYDSSIMAAHQKRMENFFKSDASYNDLYLKVIGLADTLKKKILVVEPDATVSDLLVRALSRYGAVKAVENGELALSEIKNGLYDLVVSETDLPIMDGVSLLKAAVEHSDFWRNHFVFCTSKATDEVKNVAQENGAKVLERPLTVADLRMTVRQVLLETGE